MKTTTVKVYNIITGKFEIVTTNVYNMFRESIYVLYLI
jgi:hypothetical protein